MSSSGSPSAPRRRVAGERGRSRPAAAEPVGDISAPARPIPKTPAASRWHPTWLVAGLAVLLATAALATALILWRSADDQRARGGNQRAAASAAGEIVEKMLGYDYKRFDEHTTEVSTLLTGSFRNDYVKATTRTVKPVAVQNQTTVVAKAQEVSVMSASGQGKTGQDTVRILAFVDQTTTSVKLARPQIDLYRVILTMSNVGGRWLVSGFDAF